MSVGTRVYVRRQPVHDIDLKVLGYELLFDAHGNQHAGEDVDHLAARTMVSTFTEFSLDQLVGDRLAFLRLAPPFVQGTMPVPFAPATAVLILSAASLADPSRIEGLLGLAREGHLLGFDITRGPVPADLAPFAAYLVVDMSLAGDGAIVKARQEHSGSTAWVIATGVNDRAMFDRAVEGGADYMSGRFLSRPDLVAGNGLSPTRLSSLTLLSRLAKPDVSVDELESVIKSDVALSYRVLRAANSASVGAAHTISSIRQALILLGPKRLKSWLLLMVVSDFGVPSEAQLADTMARARICELLAPALGLSTDDAFTAGLLSCLDVLLGVPLIDVLDRLPMDHEIRAALLDHQGDLGKLLDVVTGYEAGDFGVIDQLGLEPYDLSRAYLEAVGWSLQTCESVLST